MKFMEVKLPKSRFSEDKAHVETKEFKNITIPCAYFTSGTLLEGYYLDMREAFKQYDAGIFGDFDEFGVPMVGWGKLAQYSAVNIAQYGFILHDCWLENKSDEYLKIMQACLDKLIEMESREGNAIFWREKEASERYNLKTNWTSAMSQGECISYYLRMYQITKNEILLEKAHLIFNSFEVTVSNNGVSFIDKKGYLWLEEYPSTPASFVLNGFIYAVFGVMDYYRVTNNIRAKKMLNDCFATLEAHIAFYDSGYWSYYDLHYRELVKYYYQKNVHTPQLEALYQLTGKPIFKKYATKWKKSVNPINYIFVRVMYRILPRYKKLTKIRK